jgi:hypothetical protein
MEKEHKKEYNPLVRLSQPIRDLVITKIEYPESFSECLERLLKINTGGKKNVKKVKGK